MYVWGYGLEKYTGGIKDSERRIVTHIMFMLFCITNKLIEHMGPLDSKTVLCCAVFVWFYNTFCLFSEKSLYYSIYI